MCICLVPALSFLCSYISVELSWFSFEACSNCENNNLNILFHKKFLCYLLVVSPYGVALRLRNLSIALHEYVLVVLISL